jgi:hypothetical protein
MEDVWKKKVERLLVKNMNIELDNWEEVFTDLQEHIIFSDPISSAVDNNKIKIVKVLITAGYDPLRNNYHALFTAADNGNSDIVKLILDSQKVDKSILEEFLLKFVKNGNIKIVELLLKYPEIDPSNNKNQLVVLASSCGFNEIVKLLIKNGGVNPSYPNNKALNESVKNGHLNTVVELLKDVGVDPGISNNEFSKIAIKLNYDSIFKHLINDSRVNPAKNDNELIIYAASLGRNKHIEDLLKLDPNKGIDPSADNNMAIIQAVSNNHYEAVRILLTDVRVDPTAQNNKAFTTAINKGYLSIGDLLKYGRIEGNENKYQILDKTTIFKNKVKDTLSGLVAGYYLVDPIGIVEDTKWISSLYSYAESTDITSYDMFSYRFTFKLITNKTPLIDKINTINYLVKEYPDTAYSISNAAKSILDSNKILLNTSDYLYGAIRGFLLLSYTPQYTFIEIIDLLKAEGNSKKALHLAGKFIGSYLGLNELINQNLTPDNDLHNHINKILSLDITPLIIQYETNTHYN